MPLAEVHRRAGGHHTIQDGIEQRVWLAGLPSFVIDQIANFEQRYPGLNQMIVQRAEGMLPKEFKQQLRWVARDTIPHFTRC